jgi:hypothetical protein
MSAAVSVREVPEAQYDQWSRLVAQSPSGSLYSTPEYLDALCSAAGGSFVILGAWRGEELVGGVGLYQRDSRWGRFVWPRLLLYYNGPVVRQFDTKYPSQRTSRTVDALGALADAVMSRGYGSVRFKCRAPLDDLRPFSSRGWSVRAGYTYEVPLGDLPAQWGRMEQNLRRLVERARQQGLQFVRDEDFAAFYQLHEQTLGRRGMAGYLPRAAFGRWFERLSALGLCRLYHARMPDGRPAASQLVLAGAHPMTHTVSAAADPALQNTGANPFLRWSAFEALAADGFTGNDLTDASLNPVTHFKAQLGGNLCLTLLARYDPSLRWKAGQSIDASYGAARRMAASLYHRLVRRERSADG